MAHEPPPHHTPHTTLRVARERQRETNERERKFLPRERKKRKKRLPRTSSSARAARTRNSGVFSTSLAPDSP